MNANLESWFFTVTSVPPTILVLVKPQEQEVRGQQGEVLELVEMVR